MKRFLIIGFAVLCVLVCVTGRPGNTKNNNVDLLRNILQFVKEKTPELSNDIEELNITSEDSLLCDIMLAFGQKQFTHAGVDFLEGKISYDEYKHIIDSTECVKNDVVFSWIYPETNDSLRQLEKYDGCWRKVYTLRVTMKDGTTDEARLLMDNDGVTPKMLEGMFERTIEEYSAKISHALENLNSLREI